MSNIHPWIALSMEIMTQVLRSIGYRVKEVREPSDLPWFARSFPVYLVAVNKEAQERQRVLVCMFIREEFTRAAFMRVAALKTIADVYGWAVDVTIANGAPAPAPDTPGKDAGIRYIVPPPPGNTN